MRAKTRAQSSMEFIILVGAVLFFFLIFIYGVYSQTSQKASEQRNFLINDVALSVQNEINLGVLARDGYSRNFTIPLTIINFPYEIFITDGLVYARTLDGKYAIALPVADVNGSIRVGNNLIRKIEGKVYLN